MGQIIDGTFISDYDGQEIDRRLAIAGGASNPNLLDNPWFTVNQRGATSGTANDYIADRWRTNYGSGGIIWSRTANTITIQPTSNNSYANIQQGLEQSLVDELAGKTVTLSVMLSDYSIRSITNTFNWFRDNWRSLGNGIDGNALLIRFRSVSNTIEIRKNQTAETFRAVKLELGAMSTLANDDAPDYELELQKCRGHVLVVGGDSTVVLTGWMESTTLMRGSTLTDLNFTPTTISMTGSFYVYAGGSFAGVSSVALQNSNKHNIDATTSAALQNNAVAIMRGVDSNSKIVISDGLG